MEFSRPSLYSATCAIGEMSMILTTVKEMTDGAKRSVSVCLPNVRRIFVNLLAAKLVEKTGHRLRARMARIANMLGYYLKHASKPS